MFYIINYYNYTYRRQNSWTW